MNQTDANTTRQEFIDVLAIEYTPVFVPTVQPAGKVQYPSLHWSITLKHGGRSMVVAYREGSGHVKGYAKLPTKTPYDRQLKEEAIRKTCETGRVAVWSAGKSQHTHNMKVVNQPAPTLIDVLYCLVQDTGVLESGSFEEWAQEYGYDTDSRQAEKTYQLCLTQSLQLKNLIGYATLATLRELFQDY